MRTLKRILCIDDDEDILSIVEFSLADIGLFDVIACRSGRDALCSAAAFAPQLFLIDVMMPDMCGPETLVALHKIPGLESTPAIFLTATNMPLTKYPNIDLPHMLGLLTKPFDPLLLPSDINKLWNAMQL